MCVRVLHTELSLNKQENKIFLVEKIIQNYYACKIASKEKLNGENIYKNSCIFD